MIEFINHPPLWGYLLAAIIGTASWRFIGAYIIGRVDEESALFQWIAAVAYAMVAALLIRVLLLPQGNMELDSILPRCIAFFLALLAWWLGKKSIVFGLPVGLLSFAALNHFIF